MSVDTHSRADHEAPASGCFVRIVWLASNVLLLVLAATIARGDHGAWSAISGAYWAVVAFAIGIRYVDVTRLGGSTLEGKPATRNDWKRYSTRLVPLAAVAWLAAVMLG